jgi:hypothetical protein
MSDIRPEEYCPYFVDYTGEDSFEVFNLPNAFADKIIAGN